MKHARLLIVLSFFMVTAAFGQENVVITHEDSLIQKSSDTTLLKSYATRYSPRKALLYAAILPGLGQVYTKKYWKLPLVYGGFGSIGYGISFYQSGYKKYKAHLYSNIESNLGENGINPDVNRSTAQLRTIVDRFRRERDFMIILMGGMYLLQMIDAHVDAHLKEFDLNPNLQVSIEPTMNQDPITGRQTGIALIIRF